MKIGEVSKVFNISIETLRYYEKVGLLTPKRIKNNRDYTENDITKLRIVLTLKRMMFSLDEIRCILRIDEKIDESLNNKYLDKDNVNDLLLQVKGKYKEILKIEEELNDVKKKLEEIINKAEAIIEE